MPMFTDTPPEITSTEIPDLEGVSAKTLIALLGVMVQENPDRILCLAMFADGLGICVGDWPHVEDIPHLLRETQREHGKAQPRH